MLSLEFLIEWGRKFARLGGVIRISTRWDNLEPLVMPISSMSDNLWLLWFS